LHYLFLAQSWGDHIDVAQPIVMYLAMLGCLSVFCWLGNELSEQVKNNLFLYTYTLKLIFDILNKVTEYFWLL